MSSEAQSSEFPKNQWSSLREAMESGGPEAVLAFIETHDDLERRQLYLFSVGAFANREWDKDADRILAVARAGISESLRQADAADSPEDASRRRDLANVIAYNMSASLCDCWEGGDLTLETQHFESGLALAERCIAWRVELEKGPHPRSMAWWLKGMHLLSLGHATASVVAFRRSCEYAKEHAAGESKLAPEPHEHFGVALGDGYQAIAEARAGDETAEARFGEACAAFERMATNADQRDDAEFGLAQLRFVWRRYASAQ